MYPDWTTENRYQPAHRSLFQIRLDACGGIFRAPYLELENPSTIRGLGDHRWAACSLQPVLFVPPWIRQIALLPKLCSRSHLVSESDDGNSLSASTSIGCGKFRSSYIELGNPSTVVSTESPRRQLALWWHSPALFFSVRHPRPSAVRRTLTHFGEGYTGLDCIPDRTTEIRYQPAQYVRHALLFRSISRDAWMRDILLLINESGSNPSTACSRPRETDSPCSRWMATRCGRRLSRLDGVNALSGR
jgi:hypothetical protein